MRDEYCKKVQESIPYYIQGHEEYDLSLHLMKKWDISKISLLQSPILSTPKRYKTVILFCDGNSIQSYTWAELPINQLLDVIKNAIYDDNGSGALAIILEESKNSAPLISVAAWGNS